MSNLKADTHYLFGQSSFYFEDQFKIEKMNVAAIGNIVKQLHMHIIAMLSHYR